MRNNDISSRSLKPSLGLVGATVNAMALIAPGAFLWITYQLQAAATAPNGTSVASDMWAGIVLALIVAFLTAFKEITVSPGNFLGYLPSFHKMEIEKGSDSRMF